MVDQALKIENLSDRRRFGLRGLGVEAALGERGIALPDQVNTWVKSAQGNTLLRTGATEYWWLQGDNGEEHEVSIWTSLHAEDCYPLFCQDSHCWWRCSGSETPGLFAKLYAVDPQQAALSGNGKSSGENSGNGIAQTRAARINTITYSLEYGLAHKRQSGFNLLCDSSYSDYIGEVLQALLSGG